MTPPATKPIPQPTPDTAPFFAAAAEGRLSLPWCEECARFIYYPRSLCPQCGGTDLAWRDLSGRGRLHSFIISHLPAPGFDSPYVVALVELDEGPRMMSSLVGVPAEPEALTLDMALVVTFEAHGDVVVPKFRMEETA